MVSEQHVAAASSNRQPVDRAVVVVTYAGSDPSGHVRDHTVRTEVAKERSQPSRSVSASPPGRSSGLRIQKALRGRPRLQSRSTLGSPDRGGTLPRRLTWPQYSRFDLCQNLRRLLIGRAVLNCRIENGNIARMFRVPTSATTMPACHKRPATDNL